MPAKEQISLLEQELLNTANKTLLVGPHCDDIELFCGRLIMERKGKREYEPNIHALITAAGPVKPLITRLAVYAFNRAIGSSKIRIAESRTAMEQLGVMDGNVSFLPFPQMALHQFPQCVDEILNAIKNVNPDYIVMPTYEGGHVDHDTTNFFTWMAASSLGISSNRIIEYAAYRFNPSNNGLVVQQFIPINGFDSLDFDVKPELKLKWQEIMKIFRSQRNTRAKITWESQKESYRFYPGYDYRNFSFPVGGLKTRQRLGWLPFNLAPLFLDRSEKTPYDNPKYWLTLTPTDVLEAYAKAERFHRRHLQVSDYIQRSA